MPRIIFSKPEAAVAELLALMVYPDDARARSYQVFAFGLEKRAQQTPGEQWALSSEEVLRMLHARALSEIRLEERERIKRGFIAGQILATLYLLDRFHGKAKYLEPTLRRAIFATQAMGKKQGNIYGSRRKFGDGTPMPASDSTVKAAWRTYAPVAPFWAAIRICSLGYPYAPARELFKPTHFEQFLRVANTMHRFGTTFIPKGARPKFPCIDRATAFAPPAETGFDELKSARIPDLLNKIMQRYRAHKK